MDASQLEFALLAALAADSRWRGRLRWVEEVGSTNDEVLGWIAQGAVMPCALLAERQHAGRGRRGRRWSAQEARSLLLSVGWEGPGRDAGGLVALAAGLALARLAEVFGIEARIKWPNDLYLGERKAAGVLVESPAGAAALCIGIGLNATQARAEFGPELAPLATSLQLELRGGMVPARPRLAAMLLEGLAEALEAVSADPVALLGEVERRLWRRGRRVRVLQGEVETGGVLLGLGPRGELRLGTARGELLFAEGTLRGEGGGAHSQPAASRAW